MSKYYLAVDIGASSGRHILGSIEDGKMVLEEIYRFENGMKKTGDYLCWDLEALFGEILAGIKKCEEIGKIPASMGIDTWAVDYVLLDEKDQVLGKTYGYRDKRTHGMDEIVYGILPQNELYARTGIQKQIFNSIYQLMAVKQNQPEDLEKAQYFCMIPDYFHFLLTGEKVTDYTNATTTQLVSPTTKKWDDELIEKLGFPRRLFGELSMPGCEVGCFTERIQEEVGFACKVVLPPTHDTASAVLAVPAVEEDFLYISSGTWSLMGIERLEADCSRASMDKNFTNEGGYDYKFRFLKNIMGLWMIQSVRHELKDEYSFATLCDMAEQKREFPSRVDVNDQMFLAPDSMIQAVKDYCGKTKQPIPQDIGELATCIYQSLAESYARTVEEIEFITGRNYTTIHIVGGGSNAEYLNLLTAEKTGMKVLAGPSEATAIGNLTAQMIADGVFQNAREARKSIYHSFEIKKIQSR